MRIRKDEALKGNIRKQNAAIKSIQEAEKTLRRKKAAVREKKAKLETVLAGTGLVEAVADEFPEDVKTQTLANKKIIFEPTDRQKIFLAASEREVLFGGAAGGGKSYAILADPVRYFSHPDFRGILFRRTNDELRELIWKSRELYSPLFPNAKWQEQKSTWTFPSGANLWITYLDRDDDVSRYIGQSFTWIGFDELTQWSTPFAWNFMRSRLRTTSDLPLYMRATANPGNVGGKWVKAMFVDPEEAGTAFWALDENNEVLKYPKGHPKAGQPLFKRRFIKSLLTDNPHLTKTDDYMVNLLSLPETQRRQLLEGDWDVAEGAMFSEFRRDRHVVEPFDIPNNWMKFRAADWGFTSPACCLWFAVDPDGNVYIYRELYVKGMVSTQFADTVLDMESGENVRYGILDVSAWNNRGDTGPSIAEQMIQCGCRWRPSDRSKNSRTNGWMELHRRLDTAGATSLYIFSNCTNLIRTLPMVPVDSNNPEDIDTHSEDHALDALRYGLMSRPSGIGRPYMAHNVGPTYVPADAVFGY